MGHSDRNIPFSRSIVHRAYALVTRTVGVQDFSFLYESQFFGDFFGLSLTLAYWVHPPSPGILLSGLFVLLRMLEFLNEINFDTQKINQLKNNLKNA